MKKFTLFTAVLLGCFCTTQAADYQTSGNGTAYTLQSLSEIAESGVTKSESTYTMSNNITIAVGDQFNIESGITVLMGDGVQMRIEGSADFEAADRVLFTRKSETDNPKGIFMDDETKVTKFKNIDFEYCGLRNFSGQGLDVDNCSFRYNNGKQTGAGALGLGTTNACFNITNCTFEYNTIPAIGGAANYTNGVVIDNCTFLDNNTSNTNKPQINLTVGGDNQIVIKNCTVTGPADATTRGKVGGISVANMMGLQGDNMVTIENNEIRGCRYGITTLGGLSVTIKNNTIIDNKYDSNAMTGGSGISIYDSNKLQTVVVTGNRIEENLWGITVIGGQDVNVGKTEDKTAADYNPGGNIFKNNGNNGVLYDLYNNSGLTVYAQGNKWNVEEQTAENIETVVFHKVDDGSLGEVIFMPAMTDDSVESTLADNGISYANGIISLQEAGNIEVYTPNGQRVASFASAGTADLSQLPKGLYIARIATGNGVSVLKCVR